MRAPRIPGGPRPVKHNQQNRQTRESRSRGKLLDKGKQNYFRYDLEDILRTSPTPPEFHASIIQTLWAKGTRDGVDECRAFLREKQGEGLVDDETTQAILKVIRDMTTVR